jgi:hypothetical protein
MKGVSAKKGHEIRVTTTAAMVVTTASANAIGAARVTMCRRYRSDSSESSSAVAALNRMRPR